MDAVRVVLMQVAENEQRESLTEFERWQACEELRRLNPKWSAQELGTALNKGASWVTHYLSPSKCIPVVQEAFEAGRLGISDCYAISKALERDQHELLRMKLDEGASRDDLERAVKRINRPTRNGSSVRLSRIKCPLPSGMSVVVSGTGIGLDEGIEALTAAAREMKKARDEGLDAKTAQAVWQKRNERTAG